MYSKIVRNYPEIFIDIGDKGINDQYEIRLYWVFEGDNITEQGRIKAYVDVVTGEVFLQFPQE